MKISILSDLHLIPSSDMAYGEDTLETIRPKLLDCDLRLIAGDITFNYSDFNLVMDELIDYSRNFFIVMSNHSYYDRKKSIYEINKEIKLKYADYILDFHDKPVLLGENISLIGSTGWWNGDAVKDKEEHDSIKHYINDLQQIKPVRSSPMGSTISEVNLREYQIKKIADADNKALEDRAKMIETTKAMVMTHWVPIMDVMTGHEYQSLYTNQRIGQISKYLGYSGKEVVHIFGHYHKSYRNIINGIEYISNPKGYRNQNKAWQDLVIDL